MDFDKLNITDRKIIVGIDFGTTYSGVAWAETSRPDRRTAITTFVFPGFSVLSSHLPQQSVAKSFADGLSARLSEKANRATKYQPSFVTMETISSGGFPFPSQRLKRK